MLAILVRNPAQRIVDKLKLKADIEDKLWWRKKKFRLEWTNKEQKQL